MATTNKKATRVAPETGIDNSKSGKKVAATKDAQEVSTSAAKEAKKKAAGTTAKEEKKTAAKTVAAPAKKVSTADASAGKAKTSNQKKETQEPGEKKVKAASTEDKKATPKAAKKAAPAANADKAPKSTAKNKDAAKAATPKAAAKKKPENEPAGQSHREEQEVAEKNLNEHQDKLNKAIKKSKEKTKAATRKVAIPKTNTDKARKYEPEFTRSVLDQVPEEYEGPSLRYSDNDLVEFRELITKKLESAKKELGYLQGLITRKDQMGGDESENRYMTMEDGSLSMEREQLGQMASRQITFIDHLEKALMRIENKTYGVCRVTGKLIDKARLRAVPHATLSIEAKMGRN